MARKRDPQAEAYAALRRRGKREIQKLTQMYRGLQSEEKRGTTGRAIRQQMMRIEEVSNRTYLGRNADQKTRLEAREASNELRSYLGKKGERGRQQQQQRRNRIFRQQIRVEEAGGGESVMFQGTAGKYHYERLFYIATQAAWSGKANEDRDEAIMKALGVTSLEDAYEIIIGGNTEALAQMVELGLTGTGYEEGYTAIEPYITDIYDILADRA